MTDLCAECGATILRADLAVEFAIEGHPSTLTVCSKRCQAEWVSGYLEELQERFQDLEGHNDPR